MNKPVNHSSGWFRRGLCWVAALVLGFVLLLVTLWAAAALYFDVRVSWLRVPLAVAYLSGVAAIWIFLPVRAASSGPRPIPRRAVKPGITIGAFLLVLAWWLCLQPSNVRDWQPDVAVLSHADFAGNQVTIHDIRNCDYRTETDYDVGHYDKTFDLAKLRTVDLFLVNWGSPHIAHTMLSFGFEGGDQLCVSIETRKEKGELYSAVKGFFRQFELIYVIADERDVVRLRTNYRPGEEVYLYRLKLSPEQSRALLVAYLEHANRLAKMPEWYNALTSNCTTNIRLLADKARGARSPFDLRILLNGRVDELLYERGRIPTELPFAELKHRSHINVRAKAADKELEFSRLIRQDLPGATP